MVQASSTLDRVLVLEMVRVTEAAAIAASKAGAYAATWDEVQAMIAGA